MIVIVATDKPASKKVALGLLLAAVVNLRVSTQGKHRVRSGSAQGNLET